jgi:PEGA domain
VCIALFLCAQILRADDRPRVYVTDSASWETGSAGGGTAAGFGGAGAGGARPQTAEIIKTLGQRCPTVIPNNHLEVSDYVLELDHEGGKGLLAHKDKVAVFVRSTGDSIFSKSTLSVGGSVQDACDAIMKHWGDHAAELRAPVQPQVNGVSAAPAAPAAHVSIGSTPDHADIEIGGNFVGSTPSTVDLPPGKTTITVRKKGYQPWTRTMNITGGNVTVSAELEQ